MIDPRSDDAVARDYDAWASHYDEDDNATRDLDADAVRELIPRDALAGDIVEVGCGTGKNTVFFARTARSIVALDFSDGMLARAQNRVRSPLVRFVRHDVRETWPLPDASADLVSVNLVLEHLEHPAFTFREAARALRPGGRLFVAELHPYRQLMGRQARFEDETGEEVKVPSHLHEVSDFITDALTAGFTLRVMEERRLENEPRTVTPRLLALLFEKRPA